MRPILWKSDSDSSIEYFKLATHDDAFVLEGTIIMLLDGLPACIAYKVECDKDWKTRGVAIRQERAGGTQRLTLKVDEHQVWQIESSTIPFAAGIYDIDLEITPATNTIPIRRLALGEGESQEVDAVWVRFPSLTLERLHQRYTRIAHDLYSYENLLTGFQAQLKVDEFGLIIYYDDLWYRVSA